MELKALVVYSLLILGLWMLTLVFLGQYPVGSELDHIQLIRNPFADFAFKWITRLGEVWMYFIVAFYLGIKRQFRNISQIGLLGLLVLALSLALKLYFAQPRPALAWAGFSHMQSIPGVSWRATLDSFPSGHTMSAVALYGWLALRSRNGLLAALLALVTGLVGFSRIYLAEHFLKDVSMGLITGLALLWIFWRVQSALASDRGGKLFTPNHSSSN